MEGKINYKFSTKMWQHNAPGGWHFVSLPKSVAKEIREHLKWQEEGWGRMKAKAQIGAVQWETAIWYDTKQATYLLPIKAAIRSKLGITVDQNFEMDIWI